ncbi:hypothetical protein BU24DRAFT_288752 [Aaosphaeria arxii CBS 175.79]|uniref:Uncharacterized protein n=1 Tax=Aaosphaeria arxii CBS 175.79 TaxID=1450172 RepID=A0A6A5XFP7_9PLEO|nr:uncharacterized protein BU24DRAFT_288752 [Aaosphaeria arxii CBS 175.79]KAF2011763.1 hypothetical protein BU24DRAFT_288752 [Aaosphaeria arxii CBS 175.79]
MSTVRFVLCYLQSTSFGVGFGWTSLRHRCYTAFVLAYFARETCRETLGKGPNECSAIVHKSITSLYFPLRTGTAYHQAEGCLKSSRNIIIRFRPVSTLNRGQLIDQRV